MIGYTQIKRLHRIHIKDRFFYSCLMYTYMLRLILKALNKAKDISNLNISCNMVDSHTVVIR